MYKNTKIVKIDMKTKFIYALNDPNTHEVKYIGKTNNLKKRLQSHLSNNQLSSATRKNNWIISLLRDNKIPIIELLDEVPENEIDFYEIFYISLFRSWGFNLLNGTIGGDGFDWTGRKHDPISNLKNRINSPHRKSVAKYDMNGNLLDKYHSLREAGIENNMEKANISRCCRNILKTSGGFRWEFIENISEHVFETPINRVEKIKKPRLDSRLKKIDVYKLDGTLIDTCDSLSKTSETHNCHWSLIKKCCDKKSFHQTKNLTFRFMEMLLTISPIKIIGMKRRIKFRCSRTET